MNRTRALFLSAFALGCSAPTVDGTAASAGPIGSAALASSSPSASASGADDKGTLSPAARALVDAVRACKLDNGLLAACPAHDQWSLSNPTLLAGPDGDVAALSLLFDDDERVRLLGVERPYFESSPIFRDSGNLGRLVAQIDKEPNRWLRSSMAFLVGSFDAGSPAFEDAARALSQRRDVESRSGLARGLRRTIGPFKVTLLGSMLDDEDAIVRKNAADSLAQANPSPSNAQTGFGAENDRVCTIVGKALDGAHREDVLDAASQLHICHFEQRVLDAIEASTKGASLPDASSWNYVGDLAAICSDSEPRPNVATNKRAFALAKRLAALKGADTKRLAIAAFVACDPDAAKPELIRLAKDADGLVAGAAQSALASLASAKH